MTVPHNLLLEFTQKARAAIRARRRFPRTGNPALRSGRRKNPLP